MEPRAITVYGCEHDEKELFEELAPSFAIVPTFVRAPASPATADAARGRRCISVAHKSDLNAPILRALHAVGVEYISTRSIGFDHVDIDTAARLGITVDNVVYAPDGVADYTLMLILMAVRNVQQVVRRAERRDFTLDTHRPDDLGDLTVGVVGVGNIGKAVIRRLQGFGCRVLAHSNDPNALAAREFVSLDLLLRESDVVTLHAPLNRETHHLIGRAQFAVMKPGAILVNTGRGALVDTAALLEALERGGLGGAALDVLEGEDGIFYFDCTERRVDNPFLTRLQQHPNAIVTPHTAYYTKRALRDTVEMTLANCRNFERNRGHEQNQDRSLVRGLLGGA